MHLPYGQQFRDRPACTSDWETDKCKDIWKFASTVRSTFAKAITRYAQQQRLVSKTSPPCALRSCSLSPAELVTLLPIPSDISKQQHLGQKGPHHLATLQFSTQLLTNSCTPCPAFQPFQQALLFNSHREAGTQANQYHVQGKSAQIHFSS